MTAEHAVHRLTGELADWYGLDAGHLRVGDRADVLVLDPDRLDDSLEEYAEAPVEQYGGLSRMVNRNDATVSLVLVGGRAVVAGRRGDALLGSERTGRSCAPARTPRRCPASPSDDAPRRGRPRPVADPVRPRLRRHRRLGHRRLHLPGLPARPRLRRPRAGRHRQAPAGRAGATSRRTRTTTGCSSPTATT